MLTQLEIINLALSFLGEAELDSYPDVTKRQSNIVAKYYNASVIEALTLHNFIESIAYTTVLSGIASTTEHPKFAYKTLVANLPTDNIRILEINDATNFEVSNGFLYLNTSSITRVKYIKKIDESLFSATLAEVVYTVLAKNIALPVTANDALRQSALKELFEIKLQKAKAINVSGNDSSLSKRQEITNLALSHVGITELASQPDNSEKIMRIIDNVYSTSISEALTLHNFIESIAYAPSLSGIMPTPEHPKFSYRTPISNLPTDTIRILEINDTTNFEVSNGYLYLNTSSAARVKYIKKIDESLFSTALLEICYLVLAKNIVLPISGDVKLRQEILNELYSVKLPKAKAINVSGNDSTLSKKQEIINLALSHVGVTELASHPDNSERINRIIENVYATSISETLTLHNFVESIAYTSALSGIISTSEHPKFVFKTLVSNFPPDTIRILEVNDATNFEVSNGFLYLSSGFTTRVKYIKKIDESLFSTALLEICYLVLAKNIVLPISGDVKLRQEILNELYSVKLPKAKAINVSGNDPTLTKKQEVIQLAMSYVGNTELASHPDNNERITRLIDNIYSASKRELLNLYDWQEATKYSSTLTPSTNTDNNNHIWQYKITSATSSFPVDYIRLLQINDSKDFEYFNNVIYINDSSAKMLYIADIQETYFSQDLINVFALILAKNIILPLTGDPNIKTAIMQELNLIVLPRAKYNNIKGGNKSVLNRSNQAWISKRRVPFVTSSY